MYQQTHAARRFFRYVIADTVDGVPLEIHVWSIGSRRVTMSVHGIFAEMGFARELVRIGEAPTEWDREPLVLLAAIQRTNLVLGLPMMSEASEDAFLAGHTSMAERPLSRLAKTHMAMRRERDALPPPGRVAQR